jgi:hypothetical protein
MAAAVTQPLAVAPLSLPVSHTLVRNNTASLDVGEVDPELVSGSPGTPEASGDSGLASTSLFDDAAVSSTPHSTLLAPEAAHARVPAAHPSPSLAAGADAPALLAPPVGADAIGDEVYADSASDDEASSMESEELPPLRSALSGGLPVAAARAAGGMKRTVSWGDMNPAGAALSTVVEYDPQSAPIAPRSDDPAWEAPIRNIGCACCVM